MNNCLAVDLGAGSGRVIRGTFAENSLTLQEVHRFDNNFRFTDGHHRWDVLKLFENIRRGLDMALADGLTAASVGIDTWGVDFALLDGDDNLVEMPVAYRDARTEGMQELFFELVPRQEVYSRTGIQFMDFNTLFQLFALAQQEPQVLEKASSLMMIPDYLHFRLCGVKETEFTIASTSQMLNIETGDWDERLLKALQADPSLFRTPATPGTGIGRTPEGINVILPGAHDTASAVAAVPAEGKDWAYISSGTWCLMGVEITTPVATDDACSYNFTNEGGVCGTTRFLKNLMGLWIVNRLKEELAPEMSFDELLALAAAAPAFKTVINAGDQRFFNPESMVQAVDEFCSDSGQEPPKGTGGYIRTAMESLAFLFRQTLQQLGRLQDTPINRIHVLGGGCRNEMLCRMTADATGLPVYAGPVEGTATGNLIIQGMAGGLIESLDAGRRIIRNSFEIKEYLPSETARWDEAWPRFEGLASC